MVQYILTLFFVETDISCCVPRFPLILTAKFRSLYVKEWGVGNFGILESEILESRRRIFYLRLRNLGYFLNTAKLVCFNVKISLKTSSIFQIDLS